MAGQFNSSPALEQALARRGFGGGASQPQGSVPAPSMPQPQQMSPQGGMKVGAPEAEVIIKALENRLKSISKQEEGGFR